MQSIEFESLAHRTKRSKKTENSLAPFTPRTNKSKSNMHYTGELVFAAENHGSFEIAQGPAGSRLPPKITEKKKAKKPRQEIHLKQNIIDSAQIAGKFSQRISNINHSSAQSSSYNGIDAQFLQQPGGGLRPKLTLK